MTFALGFQLILLTAWAAMQPFLFFHHSPPESRITHRLSGSMV
ncbi:MAG: hypothetical protein WCS87_10615 [Methylococcaceae bacterium]